MRLLMTVVCLLAVGCTVTVAPVKHQTYRKTAPGRKAATSSDRSSMTLVDAHWIETYRRLEKEHGNYTIKDDAQIRPVGGKFQVPQSVVNNFQDLSNARIAPGLKP